MKKVGIILQRLKKFNKNEIDRKKVIMIVGVFMVVGILLLGTSYAVYQKEDEVQFINAIVRWPAASEVTYMTTSNTSVKNVEQAVNDLYGKLGN